MYVCLFIYIGTVNRASKAESVATTVTMSNPSQVYGVLGSQGKVEQFIVHQHPQGKPQG